MSAIAKFLRLATVAEDRLKVQLLTPHARRRLEDRVPTASQQIPFAVYFADVPSSAYQLQQWIPPLEALHSSSGPVVLLLRHPVVAKQLAAQTVLPMVLVDQFSRVERFIGRHQIKVLFYVNNNQNNFTALRLTAPVHVHLSHGESEKSSMYSNQLKAYDFVFVAGEASAKRILHHVRGIDPEHVVRIGRPQLADLPTPTTKVTDAASRVTVLYAPTWEGDSPQMAYGSLVTHGEQLIDRLVADARFRIVFRPHPKSGINSPRHRAALSRIRRMLSTTEAQAVGHVVDTGTNAVHSIAASDVVIADVSAMAMDALGMNRPLILCLPPGETSSELASHVAVWRGAITPDATDTLATLASAPVPDAQASYRDLVFATADPAEAIGLFITAAQRAAERASCS
ncbi:CDP-glycerol glycerophosphotransferase family protein [Arthrobacter rhombi]|uniref:CDP-glycerol glycerophosphotransferase family protein n=1 Tax=Arthrobacter rhombi TaxID=71253 RepID=UPI003FD6756F